MNEVKVRVGNSGSISITVDSELSLTSVNPVQNKVITAELEKKAVSADLAAVATSGAYSDLTGKPELAAVATSGEYSDLTGKPSLAAVATSGAYSDLTGKPSLASVATSGSYTDLSDKPTIPPAVTVDDELSVLSENPVQNKVITAALAAVSSWITSVPGMHRNIFRGQSLGSAVTSAQLAAIADGSFDDLYVGDYWTIPVTIGGVTKNINWRIADIDYYLNAGDTPLEEHHLVIVPDTGLYAARMNATASNSGGYKASEMYTTNLGTAKTAINTAFPDMVLTHRDLMPESPATAPTWADSTAELLSEIMVYGTQIFSPCNGSGQYNNFLTIAKSQLALFRLAPWFGVADDTYWLRDVVGDPSFAAVSSEGNADGWGASNEWGVRPYFLLGAPAATA